AHVVEAEQDEEGVFCLQAAGTVAAARWRPHVVVLERGDVEVLLTDRLDEWVMQFLDKYRGKPLKDVARGSIDLKKLGGQPGVETEPSKEEKHLLKRVKRVLGERVKEVRLSERLTESAACLVIGEEDLGRQMRELLKAAGHDAPETAPSLELNPRHPLIKRLQSEQDDTRFERLSLLLFEQAALAEGRPLEDPAAFVKRLNLL